MQRADTSAQPEGCMWIFPFSGWVVCPALRWVAGVLKQKRLERVMSLCSPIPYSIVPSAAYTTSFYPSSTRITVPGEKRMLLDQSESTNCWLNLNEYIARSASIGHIQI